MRLLAVLISVFLLSACGFSPLYSSSGSGAHAVQTALNEIYIDIIPDKAGQYLRNRMIDRFHTKGTPQSPQYRLNMSPISEGRTDLDITKTANTTRAQLRLSTTMTLQEAASGKVLLQRGLHSTASFNILPSQFTTRVSAENARLNVLDDLARQAEQQIVLYFKR